MRRIVHRGWMTPAALVIALAMHSPAPAHAEDEPSPKRPPLSSAAVLRRPVALALDNDTGWLYAANRRLGTVSVLNVADRSVLGEVAVGQTLSDIALVPGGRFLLATDEGAHELVVLGARATDDSPGGSSPRLEPMARLAVPDYPVSVRVSADGHRAYVASLWSRKLSVFDLAALNRADPPAPGPVRTFSLPFQPREQLLVDEDRRLLIADAFGGQFAVLDTAKLEVQRLLAIPGNNIRGMALSADGRSVYVSHMLLNQMAETTHQTVVWGIVMAIPLRSLSLKVLLSDDTPPLSDAGVHFFGDPGRAAGDPNAVAVCPDGTVLVALGGVHEVAIGKKESPHSYQRTAVGTRPTALVTDRDGRFAYAANTFSDSVSVIDVAEARAVAEVPLGPKASLRQIDRGELLFYDAERSLDGWYSCHSCHTDGYTNGLRVDNLGDGNFGAPKRVLSLLGVAQTAPWAWNGSIERLENQIHKSMVSTMQGPTPDDEQVAALAAFLESLPFAPPGDGESDAEAVSRGAAVFQAQRCARCHQPPTYSGPGRYDVGLADEQGATRFNPPTLRGVAHAKTYFHDNRARSLREVFADYQHELRSKLSDDELNDLLAFLESL